MSERNIKFATKQKTEVAKRKCSQCHVTFETLNAGSAVICASEALTFDGEKWHVYADNVNVGIPGAMIYDEDTGETTKPNPDIIDERGGFAYLSMTRSQAIRFARKLLSFASKCRNVDEVDLEDPELLSRCASQEDGIRMVSKLLGIG